MIEFNVGDWVLALITRWFWSAVLVTFIVLWLVTRSRLNAIRKHLSGLSIPNGYGADALQRVVMVLRDPLPHVLDGSVPARQIIGFPKTLRHWIVLPSEVLFYLALGLMLTPVLSLFSESWQADSTEQERLVVGAMGICALGFWAGMALYTIFSWRCVERLEHTVGGPTMVEQHRAISGDSLMGRQRRMALISTLLKDQKAGLRLPHLTRSSPWLVSSAWRLAVIVPGRLARLTAGIYFLLWALLFI
ncbi:hypothetical protein [Pseudomonas putida]